MANRGPKAAAAAPPGAKPWFRPAVVDEAFVPPEAGDGEEEGASAAAGEPPVLDAGTPCFEAVADLLKPEERGRTVRTAPDSQLALEWCHGVSTRARGHVRYGGDGSVVYPAGSLGVVYRFPSDGSGEDGGPAGEPREAAQGFLTVTPPPLPPTLPTRAPRVASFLLRALFFWYGGEGRTWT